MRAHHTSRSFVLAAALLLSRGAWAQDPVEYVPEAPLPPPPVQSGEALEPDVTIVRGEKKTVTEYRLNGQLYMIKVTPKNAPTYYLVDADGDGQLESRRSELDPGILVPAWMILRW